MESCHEMFFAYVTGQTNKHICLFFHCIAFRISLVSVSKIPILYTSAVAEQPALCLIWSKALKAGFLVTSIKLLKSVYTVYSNRCTGIT